MQKLDCVTNNEARVEMRIIVTPLKMFVNTGISTFSDHEPPECVMLSAYLLLHDGSIQCLATEEFTYYLDQTCYLARYLADR